MRWLIASSSALSVLSCTSPRLPNSSAAIRAAQTSVALGTATCCWNDLERQGERDTGADRTRAVLDSTS